MCTAEAQTAGLSLVCAIGCRTRQTAPSDNACRTQQAQKPALLTSAYTARIGPSGCTCRRRPAKRLSCSPQVGFCGKLHAAMLSMAACASQPAPSTPPSEACAARRHAGRLQPATAPQRATFMASLICNVPPSAQLLRCSQPQGGGSPAWQRIRQQPPGRRHSGAGSSSLHAGQPPSPLPAVDAFLAAVCTQVRHCCSLAFKA